MEKALHDVLLFRKFSSLGWDTRLPDETTILRLGKTRSPRRLLEDHKLAPQILAVVNELLGAEGLMLRTGTAVDATLIAAPSSRPRTPRTRVTRRCAKARRAARGTWG